MATNASSGASRSRDQRADVGTKTASHVLSIVLNTSIEPTPCAVCTKEFEPHFGPEMIRMDTGGLVCEECSRTHGRILRMLLDFGWSAINYVDRLKMWGDRFGNYPA